jgi:hypothetical protein
MRYDEMKMDEMLQLEAEKTHMIWNILEHGQPWLLFFLRAVLQSLAFLAGPWGISRPSAIFIHFWRLKTMGLSHGQDRDWLGL